MQILEFIPPSAILMVIAIILFLIAAPLWTTREIIAEEKGDDDFDIDYPDEPTPPIFPVFLSILGKIKEAKTDLELKRAYVEMAIFQGTYKMDAGLTAQLFREFKSREEFIAANKTFS